MSLFDLITKLPGVGEKRALVLKQLGIRTIEDLLTYYPYRYDDLASRLPSQTDDGQKVTFKGTISSPALLLRFGYKKSRVSFHLLVGHDNIAVSFFNQPWIKEQIELGQEMAVFGVFDAVHASLSGQKIIHADNDSLAAIYPASQSIHEKTIQQLVAHAYQQYADEIVEIVPADLRQTFRLLPRVQQIHDMHFPDSAQAAKLARRSAAFEEFFLFQMRIQLLKISSAKHQGRQINYDAAVIENFIAQLPYQLTHAQEKVIQEVLSDLKRPLHMNRLLQGDVGSGKTIVAAVAMLASISAGFQAAIMVPTEILAQQHASNLSNLYENAGLHLRVELLTSGLKAAARRQVLQDLENGEIDVIVGTHALIQPDVRFHHLGLAVIDEQHRFGVKQRATLRKQAENPDILAMTATPIPRTLAITAYGEMTISTIDELPQGRQKIITKWVKSNQTDHVFDWIKGQLAKGAQAYVVTPLIEESESLDVQNAELIYDRLKSELLPYRVSLLHGRLTNDEKQQVIDDFSNNKTQVLVTTTVIEVGVDIKNATIMVILDADRFGIAQLHQLRGRVGRGDKQSYAILVSDPKTQYGIDRMEAIAATTDGFVLAEKDLELRGPGDVIGIKQAGMPEFNVGDPIHDLKMMETAQQSAIEITSRENWDTDKNNAGLVKYLSLTMYRYKDFD
ncbi:ATP-dependent DNA helicase RecG [Oenococcus sicerae]|uniref:ATP-dependent DNA helicase RecG n=1 Tax=Oenococcus sicerae TaxID=2203724 RepID=A0AAJ1R9Q4_9LACO|nr:ATP-dependent DNA helicase RecG [Oenococcus sicerae]MDN6900347.1 ATP-dependent DNA helicase RecG [Oenococcus sicerae]QAS69922.1 ATP-dependent DNA helicase RecG [Oenococcus sicerae]